MKSRAPENNQALQESLINPNDTMRNQTDTFIRDNMESTVILKDSDYGDEESHSLLQPQQISAQKQ